jgi:hypothetical protein
MNNYFNYSLVYDKWLNYTRMRYPSIARMLGDRLANEALYYRVNPAALNEAMMTEGFAVSQSIILMVMDRHISPVQAQILEHYYKNMFSIDIQAMINSRNGSLFEYYDFPNGNKPDLTTILVSHYRKQIKAAN